MEIGCYCHQKHDVVFEGKQEPTWGGDIRFICHPECQELNHLLAEQRNAVMSHATHIKCNCGTEYFPKLQRRIYSAKGEIAVS